LTRFIKNKGILGWKIYNTDTWNKVWFSNIKCQSCIFKFTYNPSIFFPVQHVSLCWDPHRWYVSC